MGVGLDQGGRSRATKVERHPRTALGRSVKSGSRETVVGCKAGSGLHPRARARDTYTALAGSCDEENEE